MRNQIVAAITPTPEQLLNGWFFACLLLGIVAVLAATWWGSEYGIDAIVARWNRRRSATVIDFTERRRLNAVLAIRGDR